MISGFINFIKGILFDVGTGFGTLLFISGACVCIGLFMLIFRLIKSFNIFN